MFDFSVPISGLSSLVFMNSFYPISSKGKEVLKFFIKSRNKTQASFAESETTFVGSWNAFGVFFVMDLVFVFLCMTFNNMFCWFVS